MGPWLIKALNLVLLGASCYLVADVVTEIGAEALEPSPLQPVAERAEHSDDRPPASPAIILDRNLFGAQLAGEVQVGQTLDQSADDLANLEATKLPLRLLGTAAATTDERSRAAIQDEKTRKHLVVAVGDELEGHRRVRVKGIERTRVVLDNAGRLEELALDRNGPAVKPRPRPKRSPRANRRSAARKETLNDRLAKLNGQDGQGISRILSSARIVPHYAQDGSMQGMKVDAIKADSLFQRVGLVNGDIITEVNGVVVDRLDSTSAVFEELSSADEINVALNRKGETVFLSASAEEAMGTEQ